MARNSSKARRRTRARTFLRSVPLTFDL
jgi:hypothetical protein